jgi:hypothetical protein
MVLSQCLSFGHLERMGALLSNQRNERGTGIGVVVLVALLCLSRTGWSVGHGDVGDPCSSLFDCQAQGGLYCDQDEHICKQVETPRRTLPIPPGVPVETCKTATDCGPGWECTRGICGVDAHGCIVDGDCLAHQVCVPDNPQSRHGSCMQEDRARERARTNE